MLAEKKYQQGVSPLKGPRQVPSPECWDVSEGKEETGGSEERELEQEACTAAHSSNLCILIYCSETGSS